VVGAKVRLAFPLLSETQMESIRSHHVAVKGGFEAFPLPDEIWSGSITPAWFTPSGYQWIYAGRPEIEEINADGVLNTCLYNVSIELEAVPISRTTILGARFDVLVKWIPGNVTGFLSGATWDVAVSWLPGSVSIWQPGTIGDPYFSNVSLLLKMDGSNGSTTITDSSSNGVTLTNTGVTLSTADPKFGSASAVFGATAGTRLSTAAYNTLFSVGTSDFTIEYFAFVTSLTSGYDVIIDHRSGGTFPEANMLISINNSGFYQWGGVVRTTTAVTLNQWQHIAWVRSEGVITLYIDGTARGTFSYGTSMVCALLTIGAANDSPEGYYLKGKIDELRITKGVARSITVPTAAFPTP
jgi:hypothetical protein